MFRQGDILQLESPKICILVLSKDFFNQTGMCVACPLMKTAPPDALHIPVYAEDYQGMAMLEQLRSLDLRERYYSKRAELSIDQIQNITDAVQSIFDYYPFSAAK